MFFRCTEKKCTFCKKSAKIEKSELEDTFFELSALTPCLSMLFLALFLHTERFHICPWTVAATLHFLSKIFFPLVQAFLGRFWHFFWSRHICINGFLLYKNDMFLCYYMIPSELLSERIIISDPHVSPRGSSFLSEPTQFTELLKGRWKMEPTALCAPLASKTLYTSLLTIGIDPSYGSMLLSYIDTIAMNYVHSYVYMYNTYVNIRIVHIYTHTFHVCLSYLTVQLSYVFAAPFMAFIYLL